MPQTYIYPTNAELSVIDKKLIDAMVADDPIFKQFPFATSPDALVMWDQEDSTYGLMKARGANADFPPIPKLGGSRFWMRPGVYGERDDIDEMQLDMRSPFGSFGHPIDISDLVSDAHRRLATRHVNRMRSIMWTLLATGVYVVTDNQGTVIDRAAFSPQVFNATVPWATSATATPFADIQYIQNLDLGQSVAFDAGATMYMNRKTYQVMFNNTNAADLGRFRLDYGQTLVGKMDLDEVMTRNSMPRIEVIADSYLTDANTGARFLIDNKVVIVGRRTNNAPLGNFTYTRDSNIIDGAVSDGVGPVFVKTVDTGAANLPPPRQISVYRGFKGGPTIKFPSAIVIMNV